MTPGLPPSPEPDPARASLEVLEAKFRALPPPEVPDALPAKLIAAIPTGPIATPASTSLLKHWPWITAVVAGCVVTIALVIVWVMHRSPAAPAIPASSAPSTSAPQQNAPTTSPAIRQFEEAVRFDPYNADAWFNLAKAQAAAERSADAISSAQKALDIARSRDRHDLAQSIESWLRTFRLTNPGQKSP